jgi:hypothetical protein
MSIINQATFVFEVDHYIVQYRLELYVISLSVVFHSALPPSFQWSQHRTQYINEIVMIRWHFVRKYAHIRVFTINNKLESIVLSAHDLETD